VISNTALEEFILNDPDIEWTFPDCVGGSEIIIASVGLKD
jgi:hypothetical protein